MELAGIVAVSLEMILFTVARSATMGSCTASAFILSCAAATITASATAMATAIYARRTVSSSESILRNVALVIIL